MKTLAVLMISAFTFCAGSAFAEEKAPTAQQSKMKACNKEAKAKELKGDDRKTFMSTCLKKDADVKAAPAKK